MTHGGPIAHVELTEPLTRLDALLDSSQPQRGVAAMKSPSTSASGLEHTFPCKNLSPECGDATDFTTLRRHSPNSSNSEGIMLENYRRASDSASTELSREAVLRPRCELETEP